MKKLSIILTMLFTIFCQSCIIFAEEPQTEDIYLTLVNKTHRLPEKWEDSITLDTATDAWGNEVLIEHETYENYLLLEAAAHEAGVEIRLDSVYRSIDDQISLWDYFMKKYGEDYTLAYAAVPGFSEHHTGLAVDVCLIKDGTIIAENDDMLAETELFATVHTLLPKFGFILRYPEGRKDSTGYDYECWHFRYIGDPVIAQEITDRGLTLEEYLDAD